LVIAAASFSCAPDDSSITAAQGGDDLGAGRAAGAEAAAGDRAGMSGGGSFAAIGGAGLAAGGGAAGFAAADGGSSGSAGVQAAVAGTLAAGTGGKAGSAGAGGTLAAGGHSAGASAPNAGTGGSPRASDISVWIAGDSTVANGQTPCPRGWGAAFAAHFAPGVKVVNSAVGGRSVRTWLYNVGTSMDSSGECVLAKDSTGEPTVQARWQAMLDGMRAGDYLLIQFGINDSSATCDRHVGLAAFESSYGVMAAAAKSRGAQPIFITPSSSIACNGSTARGTRGGYVTATLEAGMTYDVPVLDLHQRSVELYNSLHFCPVPGGDVSATTSGPVGDFFCDDHTHFSSQGAAQIGELIVQALRDQKLGLAAYLK
jgi:lysophospholipase L1-like esterase